MECTAALFVAVSSTEAAVAFAVISCESNQSIIN